MASDPVTKVLWWLCLLVAPAVLISIELFHPAGFTGHPGMYEYLHKPEPYDPRFAALAYFGPSWWFVLHMIQTPMVGLVAVGLWLLASEAAASTSAAATVVAWLARCATFVLLIYYTALDSIGGFGLARSIELTERLARAGTLTPEQLQGVVMVLNGTWRDTWVGGVGSFVSLTGSWAAFASALLVAIALLLARKAPWPALVVLVAFGWELQVSHTMPHGPIAFGLLIVAALWMWWARRTAGAPHEQRHVTGRVATIVAVTAALAGCATTTEQGAVGVERRQLLLLSSAEMDQSAAVAYQNVLKEQGAKGSVNRDPQQVARVRRIAARLTPHTAVFRKDAPGWKWEVNVITSPELNAWCMPGGKIAFYTGILEKLQMTDDEVAAVMGHEIAHALREHARERASQQMATAVGAGLVSSALGIGQGGADLVGMVGQVTFLLPYSRLHETEADRMGVELAARGGYDPRAAIALWQKMARFSSGGAPPQILSTHPSNAERIQDLGVFAQRVLPLYEQARAK